MDETVENVTEAVKVIFISEGAAVAYASLLIMASIPIVVGSFRSIKSAGAENSESIAISAKRAALFPIVGSVILYSIYLLSQSEFLSNKYMMNSFYRELLLSVYFSYLGVNALYEVTGPYVNTLLPSKLFAPDRKKLVTLSLCGVVGLWYSLKQHWIANNLFAMAFAIVGVELIQLDSVSTGCIFLGGAFLYDVLWVFDTDVVDTVTKSLNAPIKLNFPIDLLEKGIAADKFAMLGLRDIVVPGIFFALLLRFDLSLKRNSKLYFYSSFIAYIAGLVTTIVVAHVFKHAQPALLYLVPYCVGVPLFLAFLKGDLVEMFNYQSGVIRRGE